MTTAALSATDARPSKALNISLWTVQVLLGGAFAMAGFLKSSAPIEELTRNMAWVSALPSVMVRMIGAAELAGGVGLVLPMLTRILPRLTAWAGVGLATIMALAIPFHLSRGENAAIVFNLLLGGLAAFVAWGRFRRA